MLTIQVSWGELLDKISILRLKTTAPLSDAARKNVALELALLERQCSDQLESSPFILAALRELHEINQVIWNAEDTVRGKEAKKQFDDEFVRAARTIYIKNDQRAALKKKVNQIFHSEIDEEKHYTPY